MLWILLAAAICAVDLGIKHYIDTHKEENCYEPAVGGRIIITRFPQSRSDAWLDEEEAEDADGNNAAGDWWCWQAV